jgi:RNA polymerase sigma-70 factor (ECF subfamily)
VDLFSFDAEYLQRLKGREPATESHFVSYFTPRLDTKLRQRGFTPADREEIRQDTLYRVLIAVQAGSVEHPERFGAFVASVCNHVMQEVWRTIKRNQHADVEDMEVPDHRVNVESTLLRKEKKQMVSQIIDEMSPKKREILRAFLFEHLDREELCERFGVTGDYLRVLLFRAKEEFSARLKGKGWNGPGNDDAPRVQ